MASLISVNAAPQLNQLFVVFKSPVIAEEYVAQSAHGAHFASEFRPDCVFFISQAAKYSHPKKDKARALN